MKLIILSVTSFSGGFRYAVTLSDGAKFYEGAGTAPTLEQAIDKALVYAHEMGLP
jgi:hypothetical protein